MEVVEQTCKHTTNLAKVFGALPMKRHFKSRFPQLNRNRLRETYCTDTFFSSETGLGGITCAQLYCGKDSLYTKVYGMNRESQGPETLEDFIRDIGAPYNMHNDNAKMETGKAWTSILRKYNISATTTEPHHPHQNKGERRIQDIKSNVNKIMDHTGSPAYLWFYCTEYVSFLLNHRAHKSLKWKTPIEKAFGYTPDITVLLQYAYYEPIYYFDHEQSFPHTKELPGHFIGIAENIGDALTYYVLTTNKTVLARSVLRSALTVINKRSELIRNISSSIEGDTTDLITNNNEIYLPADIHTPTVTHDSIIRSATEMNGDVATPDLPTIETLRGYVFVGENNGIEQKAIVTDWTKEGKFIIKFIDGGQQLMDYNTLINIYNKSEEDGCDEESKMWVFTDILDHKYDEKEKIYTLKILWENNEVTWEPMVSIKSTDPLTLAEYAHKFGLTNDKQWKWAKRFNKKNTKFLNMAKVFQAQQNHHPTTKYKFGIEVPKGIKAALSLDKINNNNLWKEAIDKEIASLLEMNTFEITNKNERLPVEYGYVPIHFVFDVKYDLRRKARLVAGGNVTAPPTEDIYSGVVSIENVRIALLLADANKLEVVAADVGNAYLYGTTNEKVFSIAGPEFGKYQGKKLVIRKALYGLKTSAARWHEALADTLQILGYFPCQAENDIWMKEKEDHYEYICVYVDDLIIMARDPMKIIEKLKKISGYSLKGVGEPEYYLGGDIKREENGKGHKKTILSAKTYIKNICKKIEKTMECQLKNYHSPLEGGYHPELDQSEPLSTSQIPKYRMLVGCANWAVTLGRYDIMYAVVTMARYNHLPREGHLKSMLRLFGYLKNHSKGSIRNNLKPMKVSDLPEVKTNWKSLYPGAKEDIPLKFPTPKGMMMEITSFFDADHAHDQETRRSVTGVILFLMSTPVKWYSKRQNTVESSSFGSEIVAGRITTDIVIEMRYKLRMLGVKVKKCSVIFGDNKSVILSTSLPSSTLKKKHNAIAYHRIREAVAAGIIRMVHVPGVENIADILTKPLGPHILYRLIRELLFNKPPKDVETDRNTVERD